MRYGFTVYQRTGAGHPRSHTACQIEHDVPVVQLRIWLKYPDKGRSPTPHRHLQ